MTTTPLDPLPDEPDASRTDPADPEAQVPPEQRPDPEVQNDPEVPTTSAAPAGTEDPEAIDGEDADPVVVQPPGTPG